MSARDKPLEYLFKGFVIVAGRGVWVVGTVVDADQELYDTEVFDGPVAIVIGNENKGMGRLIREKCDVLVKLPMAGQINSLNASVAAGVVMYEVLRRRRLQG